MKKNCCLKRTLFFVLLLTAVFSSTETFSFESGQIILLVDEITIIPKSPEINDTVTLSVKFINAGKKTARHASFSVKVYKNEETADSWHGKIPADLENGESYIFSRIIRNMKPGLYEIEAWIKDKTDPGIDTKKKIFRINDKKS